MPGGDRDRAPVRAGDTERVGGMPAVREDEAEVGVDDGIVRLDGFGRRAACARPRRRFRAATWQPARPRCASAVGRCCGDRAREARHRLRAPARLYQHVAEPHVRLRVLRDPRRISRKRLLERAPRSSPDVTCASRAASSRRSLGSGRHAPRVAAAAGRVAERLQARERLRIRRRTARGSVAAEIASILRASSAARVRLRRDQSSRLAGVAHDVVELGAAAPRCTSTARRGACAAGSSRNRAAARTTRRRARARYRAPRRVPDERSMPSASNGRRRTMRGDRRRDVDERHRIVHDRPRRGHAGPANDQRHAQRRVVDEHAVADFAVLAERLAVIRGERRSAWTPAIGPERLEQPAACAVRLRDLVVVARLARTLRVDRVAGSPYGACGSNRCTQRKNRSPRCRASHAKRLVDDRAARPLVGRRGRRASARHRVAVGLEPLDQAEAAVERERGDERAGREARPARTRSASVGVLRSIRMPLWRAPCPGG